MGVADLAVRIQIENADVGEFRAIEQLIEISCKPFQIGSLLPKAVDPGLIEIDTDKAGRCQGPGTLQ